ncbi:MAG: hypothetical protein R3293_23860, partial [Candidatus Promineifilaceae bacterium]|nr:hypothetical protein [Candidatus Promineifilaceae bacterium]
MPITAVPTQQVTATGETKIVTPTPSPQIENSDDELIICMEQEPKTLFWHGHESVFEEAVLHGIYESDLTTVSYDYQAVGLEKIP